MKKFLLIAAFAAVSILAIPASAQITGATVLRSLGDQINRQSSSFLVQLRSDGMHLKDAATGNEVLEVVEKNAQWVTISGVVAHLNRLSPALKQQVLRRIALFNFSSPVGTLVVNEKTGEVTMEHHLNPRLVNVTTMAQVTTMVGNSVREQSQVLAAH